ncbi:MAG TPA: uroporphyrinogen-III C-methyltransferase [Rheinheimera sp.]|uniref:uroporphyrinogen-III C-methyltransferase n=1 Tax=Rheinheimera sp. TaxID=1869214 RepID=UPI002F923F6C
MRLLNYVLRASGGDVLPWAGFWRRSANDSTAGDRRKSDTGRVILMGAGPGDPELLTLKAARFLQQADVLLFDNLVSADILAMAPRRCKKVYVGKRAGQHAMSQHDINQLILHYAAQGGLVVRLKGGDPAIFGRVSEEAAALQQAGIAFAIVPGVTTACAAATYSGIALTARGSAAAVQFLTAQFADPARQPDWSAYQYRAAGANPTLVVYMGLGRLQQLCDGLQSVGWPADTAIALLDQVSTAAQQEVTGNLDNIVARYHASKLNGPTLIVVGCVVQQRMAVDLRLLQAASLGEPAATV